MRTTLLLILLALPVWPSPVVVVNPSDDLAAALAGAPPGARVEVRGGIHPGNFRLDRPVRLVGLDRPVLDGQGHGTVVRVTASDVTVTGFVVRGSGDSLDAENSGIAVEAPRATIEDNRLEDTLFGVYLRKAPASLIRANRITSKDLPLPRRGDPIRIWYSNRVRVEDNLVERGRDVVLWYSEHLDVHRNSVKDGRYGLHFMYCDDARVESNILRNNSVGAFMMYSRRVQLRRNRITGNRGPSGYGVGLKDMDDAVLEGNLLADNRIGASLDNSPREIRSTALFRRNLFAYNDVGVKLLPSARRTMYTENSFLDNQEQVRVDGGGRLEDNCWAVGGRGNYWSDYHGFDRDGDGLGDLPYRSERLFEDLTTAHPSLRLFLMSPASQAIDFAAKAFPVVKPVPKLADASPMMEPVWPEVPSAQAQAPERLALAGAGLLLSGLLLSGLGRLNFKFSVVSDATAPRVRQMVAMRGVTMRFGPTRVLDELTLSLESGASLALWGMNGAGKTTAIRCLLGLYRFGGEIVVDGIEVARDGRLARERIGFVPQEISFHDDLSVTETLDFYSLLRRAPEERSEALLRRVGLGDHRDKLVQHLSGGLKQRLALAVALLSDPPLLVLDEPTANLDSVAREGFLELLLEFKAAGKTLLFTSHRPEEIQTLADRVVVLEAGRVRADGSPREVAYQLGWAVAVRFRLDDPESAARVLEQAGYRVCPARQSLVVEVPYHDKARLLQHLYQAGLSFGDFELTPLLGRNRDNVL
ncbi:MAG: nitrous oxide reductase family maturation protein NosD [Vulcanimicrobiota bacterium]